MAWHHSACYEELGRCASCAGSNPAGSFEPDPQWKLMRVCAAAGCARQLAVIDLGDVRICLAHARAKRLPYPYLILSLCVVVLIAWSGIAGGLIPASGRSHLLACLILSMPAWYVVALHRLIKEGVRRRDLHHELSSRAKERTKRRARLTRPTSWDGPN
jgi:hypothetical protein